MTLSFVSALRLHPRFARMSLRAPLRMTLLFLCLTCFSSSTNAAPLEFTRYRTLLYTGWGTGRTDDFTTTTYESIIIFTPGRDMRVKAVKPRIHSCSGECVYEVHVTDTHGKELASLIEREARYSLFDGMFPQAVIMKRGEPYTIEQKVTSNKDGVGFYTAGGAPFPNTRGEGTIQLIYAKEGLKKVDYRGPIAFSVQGQFLAEINARSTFQTRAAERREQRLRARKIDTRVRSRR
jgi:hypothetical protein